MYLIGIAVKSERRKPLSPARICSVTKERGIEGDCRGAGRSKTRQVTVISLEQWIAACVEVGIDLPWHSRRAGLCINGHVFGPGDVGKRLCFPQGLVLEITGETTPCSRMDEVCVGLKDALTPDWRGGVTCKVIESGAIFIGDKITWNTSA